MKILKVKSWCFALLTTVCCAPAWAGFPVSRTPPLEGRVTDARTGEPIENAIVVFQWYGGDCLSVHGPSAKKLGRPLLAVTDNKGDYRIPGRTWMTLCGMEGFSFGIGHPLYAGSGETAIFKTAYKAFESSHAGQGGLRYDAQLVSQDEKFKNSWIAPDKSMIGFNYSYFLSARKLGLSVEPKSALEKWQEWATRFQDSEMVRRDYEAAKQRLEDIMSLDSSGVEREWRRNFK